MNKTKLFIKLCFLSVCLFSQISCSKDDSEIIEGDKDTPSDTTEDFTVGGTVAEAVDLGLSVKWASHNIGASAPEEFGGHYGWGDPTGKKTSTNNGNYPWKEVSALNGPGTLPDKYDIAYQQWGKEWRLPTIDEVDELITKCTWTWTKYKNVEGYQIVAPNHNSIFLPAAGVRYGTNMYYANGFSTMGFYWTGQRRHYNGHATGLRIESRGYWTVIMECHEGYTMRAVKP